MQPKQDELSAVTLVLKDGKEIPAIRNELSVASDFFSTLLGSGMRESSEGIIRLEHITETCMRDIIEFMRCSDVSISQENAQDLFEAADYLLIPKLKTLTGRFLGQNIELSTTNYISTYYYAERYQITDLAANSRRLILSNFTTVAQSQEFLSLESHQVEQWICSDDIVVSTEDEVFKIILGWIEQSKNERKGKFEELFRHVRLAFISRDYLRRDVVTNDLVKENSSCLELVKCAMSATYCKNGDRPHPPRKWYETHLFVFTGKETMCYQPDKDEWYRLEDAPYDDEHERVSEYKMKSFEGKVYVFMHWLSRGATASAMYDPSLNSWMKVGGGCNKSAMSQVVVVGGEMYSVITKRKEPNSTTNLRNNHGFYSYVSRYNFHSNYWKETFPLRAGNLAWFRGEGCTVAMDNCLYVLGGCLITGCATRKARRLDIAQKKWENIANMKIARFNACGVAAHRKIFIAGGITRKGNKSFADVDRTATCEVYDPETNEWQLMASLNRPRSGGSMVCFKGTLYVLGWGEYIGRIGHAPLRLPLTVESFDLKTKKWKQKTKIPVVKDLPKSFFYKSWSNVQACVVNMYIPNCKEVPGDPIKKGSGERISRVGFGVKL